MALIDYLRGEYISGKVMDKYTCGNGNIGVVVQQKGTYKQYHVEFRDDKQQPGIGNLYGLLNNPFNQKTDSIDRLINKGDDIEMTVDYSRSPFRNAYRIHSASHPRTYRIPNKLTYKPVKMSHY